MTTYGATPDTASVPRHAARGPAFRAGFTMVEMLTVIGIIVILMAILLPVVGKVRLQARVAATQQELNKLGDAIEQYYLEYKAYPGPVSNAGITNQNVPVPGMTMTENMVLALCGGLQVQNGTVTYVSTDLQGAMGPLVLNANQYRQARHTPFIDVSPGRNMPDLPWDNANGRTGMTDSYIPEFLDRFIPARPILYLRALKGNPVSSGTNPNYTVCGANDSAASCQYNYSHLTPYATTTDFKMGGTIPTDKNGNPIPNGTPYYNDWQQYLRSPNLANAPRGADKFILICAGPDGIFGTQDDIFYP